MFLDDDPPGRGQPPHLPRCQTCSIDKGNLILDSFIFRNIISGRCEDLDAEIALGRAGFILDQLK
jgi:hypothetical protein